MPPDVPKTTAQDVQDHHTGLHAQAADLLTHSSKRSPALLKLEKDGTLAVTAGSTLFTIACGSLALRNELPDRKSDEYKNAVEAEMDRIIEDTKRQQPRLASRITRDHIEVGWKLNVGGTNESRQPVWTEAKTNEWTVVKNGQHVLANADAWLIVQPGGDAVLNPGSKAIVAPHGKIEKALPGSFVVALKGSEIHDYGANITNKESGALIIAEDLNSLHLTNKSSERLSASEGMTPTGFLQNNREPKRPLSTRIVTQRTTVSSDAPS